MKPKHKRLVFILGSLVMMALAASVILYSFRDNMVFFYTPTQLAEKKSQPDFVATRALRIGGLVKKGSIKNQAGGGIHFVIDNGDWTITGYLRVNGRCEILGIASVSLELYVGLTYIPHENAVLGEAQIVATVRVLFAKKTFRVPFKKRFAGPSIDEARVAGAAAQAALSGPPGFQMAMDPPGFQGERPWDTHCMAYAE